MSEFEIYFRDLTPEAQKAFLRFVGIADAKDGNYDVFPITTIEAPEPELTEFKLYCPLVVCADPNSELGYEYDANGENEPHEISNKAARYFETYVSEALDRSMTEETPRGLMDYFDGSAEVNEKVYSMRPAVEVRNDELMGVCILKTKAPLTAAELNEVREAAIGQFADGWGEGFEQHGIKTPLGDLYVSFWNSDKSYALRTEQEMAKPPKNRGDAR